MSISKFTRHKTVHSCSTWYNYSIIETAKFSLFYVSCCEYSISHINGCSNLNGVFIIVVDLGTR